MNISDFIELGFIHIEKCTNYFYKVELKRKPY